MNEEEVKERLKKNANKAKTLILGQEEPSTFLKISCYLSFGLSGVMTLLLGMVLAFVLITPDKLEEIKGLEQFVTNGVGFFGTYLALHLLALISTVMMWRKNLNGFYGYTVSSIAMVLLPIFMIEGMEWDLPSIILTLLMITLFALNIPQMK